MDGSLIPIRPHPLARLTAASAMAWVAFALALAPPVQADPNRHEQLEIEEGALRAFRQMIALWREELYFELYDEGWAASRERLSTEEFARRMVELSWVPQGELDAKFLKTDFRHRTMVYVRARLLFQNKFNPAQRFAKDYSTLLLKENGRWRIDLVQLVRSPYS
jgi:hypothetical protein